MRYAEEIMLLAGALMSDGYTDDLDPEGDLYWLQMKKDLGGQGIRVVVTDAPDEPMQGHTLPLRFYATQGDRSFDTIIQVTGLDYEDYDRLVKDMEAHLFGLV